MVAWTITWGTLYTIAIVFEEDLQEELNLLQAALNKKVLSACDAPVQSVHPEVKRGKSLQAVRQQLGLQPEVAKEGCANEG